MGDVIRRPDQPALFAPPSPITPDHDLSAFRSGTAPLDEWLRQRALRNEGLAGRTYVVCAAGLVVAYYCLASGAAFHAGLPGKLRRNMPDPVPMLVLGRLAVDERYRGGGLGAGLLRDAMQRAVQASRVAGARALMVHAKDDAALAFYLRYGFLAFPEGTRSLFLPIETIVQAL